MKTTRRRFLQLGASGVALIGLAPLSAAASRRNVNLGFSLYGMKSLPISRAFAACKQIGYDNVELALITGFPTDPAILTSALRAEVRQEARTAGLRISSLLANLSLAADDTSHRAHLDVLRRAAEFAAEIDPTAPPVIQTVLGGKPEEWESLRNVMATRLNAWNEIARDHGVTVAMKAHVSGAVNTPDRLLWLLQHARGANLAAAYDYSHYALAGLSIESSLRPLTNHLRFVHLKDAEGDPKQFRFLLPGEGTTDYTTLFRLLAESGYRGPNVVEVSSQIFNRPGYDPIAAAEKSYSYLAGILRK